MMKQLVKYSAVRWQVLATTLLLSFLPVYADTADWHTPVRFRCPAWVPKASVDQSFKVMTYNVQFMAGGVYNFWDGADAVAPLNSEEQNRVAARVADIIKAEQPDIVFLQEVDRDQHSGQDQLEILLEQLQDLYPCYGATSYSRVNHSLLLPEHKCPAEQNLVTLSRYQIDDVARYSLPRIPPDHIKHLEYRRAILKVNIPLQNSRSLLALNLHLDAFAQGTDTMQKQVHRIKTIFEDFTANGHYWLAGGDFNLLPPGQFNTLPDIEKIWYQPKSELEQLTSRFNVIPSVADATGMERRHWVTQKNFAGHELYQTLDYIFYSSRLMLVKGRVWSEGNLDVSDHVPVIGEFRLNRLLRTP